MSEQVTVSDMYPTTLRMLATRVIVGEVRGVEAVAMLDAMSSGGRGSMCTLHADSPRLVLPRLTQLCRPAGMSREEIHELIANSVDFIVYLQQVDETAFGWWPGWYSAWRPSVTRRCPVVERTQQHDRTTDSPLQGILRNALVSRTAP
ncbi:CpaF/VirB11 family protein [Streptomyces sp. NBC_00237]|nr:CpaF/VirB11 family protein [Streptomyces sp. NBC_00237]